MFLKKIFPVKTIEDDWISFSRTEAGRKSFFKVNRVFSDIGAQKGYIYFLKVSLFLDTSLEKKHNLLYEIEDTLSEYLEEKFQILFVGTKKTETKYKLYFYSSKDTNTITKAVQEIVHQFSNVDFGIVFEKDTAWKKYFTNIAPTDFESESYENELKFYEGEKNYFGQEKVFFYFVSYRKEELFTYFQRELERLGFQIVSKGAGRRKNFPYALKISKKQEFRLQEINNSVEKLLNLSEKFHFIYEGWVLEQKKTQTKK